MSVVLCLNTDPQLTRNRTATNDTTSKAKGEKGVKCCALTQILHLKQKGRDSEDPKPKRAEEKAKRGGHGDAKRHQAAH